MMLTRVFLLKIFRGFRQATRGPDTGAFHHSLFRRHQPDLCLQMVCQKSRERQASHLRSLPPKKRSVSERASSHESLTHLQQGPMTSLDPISPSIASVSADDRSVTSFANSTTSSFAASRSEVLVNPLATVVFTGKGDMGLVPFILNDSALVAKTLQRRDTLEVVRAAKAMLHEAYMKALRGEGV